MIDPCRALAEKYPDECLKLLRKELVRRYGDKGASIGLRTSGWWDKRALCYAIAPIAVAVIYGSIRVFL